MDTTTEFLLDGGAVVGEQIGSGVDTYLRGSNLISANGDTYYLFNGHGDVVNLSNTNGTSTKTYEYDAFGVEQNIDELDGNPFRYCGEYFDRETGTYYLRARYYDPKRGRFTQEDTLALNVFTCTPQILLIAQVGNKYVYCANNPVMYSDPSGNKVDMSPDPRQAAIDDGGTAPADDSSSGSESTGGNGSTSSEGSAEPDHPIIPGGADDGSEPTPDAFDYEETGESQTGSLLEEPSQGDSVENEVNPATNESGGEDEVIRTSTELVLDSLGDMALFTAGYITKISAEVVAVISYASTAVVGTAAAPATGGLSAAAAFAFMVLIAETGYAIVGDVATVISAFAEYFQDNSVTLELFFPSSFEEVLEFVLSGPVRIGD